VEGRLRILTRDDLEIQGVAQVNFDGEKLVGLSAKWHF